MAVTVSAKNYSLIDEMNNAANWTGEVPADVTDFYKEGTECVGFTVRGNGDNDTYITGTWNLLDKHLRFWLMTTVLTELNYIQVYISDGVSTGYWTVMTAAQYPGGWYNIVLDLARNVTSGTKPDMTAVTTIGLRFNHTGTAKNAQNTWVDHIYTADGLIAYGDDSGPFDLADVLSADENTANGWGIIRKISGVYYLVGGLDIGDESSTNSCNFKDTGQVVIFEDRPVGDDLYKWRVVGNPTGNTGFQLGNKSGDAGIQGLVVKSEAVDDEPLFDFLCSGILVSGFLVYGSTFVNASGIVFPTSGESREVIGCNFESSYEVLANSCKVRLCKFIGADDRGVRMEENHDIEDSDFIACSHGIHILYSGEYDFVNLQFLNNLYDIENSISGVVTVNNLGTSDATTWEATGGGTVSIVTGVFVTITVIDEDTDPIQDAQVAVYRQSDNTELMNEDSDVDGEAQVSFNYPGSEVPVYIRVRKSSGGTRYNSFSTTGTIDANGLTLTVTLTEDTTAE